MSCHVGGSNFKGKNKYFIDLIVIDISIKITYEVSETKKTLIKLPTSYILSINSTTTITTTTTTTTTVTTNY